MKALLAAVKRGPVRRSLWIVGCILAVLSLAIHEIAGENGYWARRQRHRHIRTLQGEIEKLKQGNQRLTNRINDLRSDPDTIEKLAREQLRMGRPGEVIVSLPTSPHSLPPSDRDKAR